LSPDLHNDSRKQTVIVAHGNKNTNNSTHLTINVSVAVLAISMRADYRNVTAMPARPCGSNRHRSTEKTPFHCIFSAACTGVCELALAMIGFNIDQPM